MRTVRSLLLALAAAMVVAGLGAASATAAPFVYATLPGSAKLFELDASAGALTSAGVTGNGNGAAAVAVTPDGTSVYVVNHVVRRTRAFGRPSALGIEPDRESGLREKTLSRPVFVESRSRVHPRGCQGESEPRRGPPRPGDPGLG